jgi:hypothetical protein
MSAIRGGVIRLIFTFESSHPPVADTTRGSHYTFIIVGWRAETSSGSTSHLIRPRACSRSLRVTSKTNSDEAHGDALRHATCNATFLTRGHNLARPPVCTENLIRIDCVTESPNVNGALHNADIKALRVILSDPFR